jgi:hypothetical protein
VEFAGCQKARVNNIKLFQSSEDTEFLGLWTYTRLCLSVFWGYGVWLGYVDCRVLSILKCVGCADAHVSAFLCLNVGC